MNRLRAQIIAWSFIPAAVMLGVVALVIFATYQRITEDLVAERNQALAGLLADQLAGELESRIQPLRLLAAIPDIFEYNPTAQQVALRGAQDRLMAFDAGVVVLDAAGTVTAATLNRLDMLGAVWTGPHLFDNASVRASGFVFSDIASLEDEDVFVAAVPVFGPAGEFAGTVAGMVLVGQRQASVNEIYTAIHRLLGGTGGTVYLVDGTGRVIYHPDTWQIGVSYADQPAVARATQGEAGTWRGAGTDGREILASFAPVWGWGLVLAEDWTVLLAASDPYRLPLLMLLGLGLLVPVAVVGMTVENLRLRGQAEAAAAAAERTRLARDLHDAVSQTLFSASMIANVLPRLWERYPDEARRQLAQLHQLTRGAQAEMRALLLELRPAVLDETALPDLLRQLGQAVSGRALVPVEVSIEAVGTVPLEVKEALYRIAQEALNNAAKHAGADQVRIDLACDGERITLSIQDDGCGFDPAAVPKDRLGQQTMRERAAAVGAALEVQSAPGAGTRIRVDWPLPN